MLPKDASNIACASASTSNILSLKNDCLERICTYLNLREKISFSNVCTRFRDAVQRVSRRLYKACDLYSISYLTPFEMFDFFRVAGEGLEQLTCEDPFRDRDAMIILFATNCLNLRELTLCNCFLNDDCVEVLRIFLIKIESLTLCDNRNITGKFISNMVHLRELNLSGCIRVKALHLMAIFAAAPNLKLLDIRGCPRSRPELYEAMTKYCQQLEVLKITCPKFSYASIAALPRLRELILVDNAEKHGSQICFYEQLVHKSRRLEVLEVHSNNALTRKHLSLISELQFLRVLFVAHTMTVNNDVLIKLFSKLQNLEALGLKGCICISAKGILQLLQHCTKLNCINLLFCRNITNKFIIDSIPILWSTYNERKRPLHILAYNTNINTKELEKELKYVAAVEKSLIKIRDSVLPTDLDGGPFFNYARIGPFVDNSYDDGSIDEDEEAAFLLANMAGILSF